MVLDGADNLYIADGNNRRIRKVDAAGVISTIAGTGERGFSGDGGPAVDAPLNSPIDVALDSAGSLYIADQGNHRVRILTPLGTEPALSAVLNVASFTPGVAPVSIASLFGERLALETVSASVQHLLAALGGIRIEIIDPTEAAREALLLHVSPGRINFLIPDEAAPDTGRRGSGRVGDYDRRGGSRTFLGELHWRGQWGDLGASGGGRRRALEPGGVSLRQGDRAGGRRAA